MRVLELVNQRWVYQKMEPRFQKDTHSRDLNVNISAWTSKDTFVSRKKKTKTENLKKRVKITQKLKACLQNVFFNLALFA